MYIEEVPLRTDTALALSSIPQSLFEEEHQTFTQKTSVSDSNPLTVIHNDAGRFRDKDLFKVNAMVSLGFGRC